MASYKMDNEQFAGQSGSVIGIMCGIGGGMSKYLLQVSEMPFYMKLGEAGLTALLCGVLGAAGKHLYDLIKAKYFTTKKIRK